ncbi:hypothetical protein HHL21_02045 [Massilia sp. RP-1-19]|uniref:Uncharacterized protein n=1 Tax=Massilia polaris TaxID=2728846 RepID=A0A848HFY4_9BURK|nr:hypothetical protein [Massilia polaris]NML59882.1 hypothetical protein [Massilia polaris]
MQNASPLATTPVHDIVTQLRTTLKSDAYAERLATIHRYYNNLKSEGRYRDALLELFNQSGQANQHGWRAYAEADKVDLVVTQPDMGRDGWVKVELKYQFIFDLASRVSTTLGKLKRWPGDLPIRQQLQSLPKCDLQRIALDCIGKDSDDSSGLCDVFVLIVQDRFGAAHPDAVRSRAGHAKSRPWKCPELDERGVRLQFLREQAELDALHDRVSYDKAWTGPTWDMLKLIHEIRPFNLQVVSRKMADDAGPFPLTSYIFTLDFTAPRPLPTGVEWLPA